MLGAPREIRVVFTEEFRRAIHRKSYLILTLAIPVILLVLLVAVPVIRGISGDDEDRDKDQDQIGILELSGELAVDAGTVPGFQIYQDRESGIAALLADEIKGFFVIPEDYLATGKVEWLDPDVGIIPSGSISGRIREFLRDGRVGDEMVIIQYQRKFNPGGCDVINEGRHKRLKGWWLGRLKHTLGSLTNIRANFLQGGHQVAEKAGQVVVVFVEGVPGERSFQSGQPGAHQRCLAKPGRGNDQGQFARPP